MPTEIEWAEETWNPITGCTPVSPGCANCYARRMAQRLKGRYGYPKDEPFRVTLHPDRMAEPLKWRKPRRVFVCSMGDLFHPDVSVNWWADVFKVMCECPQHTFQLLTKRPEGALFLRRGYRAPPNIWWGVTAENQEWADKRIPVLLAIPAAVRFVSFEPLLGPVDLRLEHHAAKRIGPRAFVIDKAPLDWCIVGCETGPGRRPCPLKWVRHVVDQCAEMSVPVFVKKLEIDGKVTGDMDKWPEDLRVRQFPEGKEVTA